MDELDNNPIRFHDAFWHPVLGLSIYYWGNGDDGSYFANMAGMPELDAKEVVSEDYHELLHIAEDRTAIIRQN